MKSEARFVPYPLFKKVRLFEWTLLLLCMAAEFIAWKFGPSDPTAPQLVVSLFILCIVAVLSFFTPLEGSYWDRLCFLFLEIMLLTGATAEGMARFVFPLFTVVIAKACLLLDRRGLIIIGIAAFLAQIVWASYKLILTMPSLLKDGWNFKVALTLILGSSVLTYVATAVMVLVAMLTLALMNEQKSRLETERLSKEVESLATEVERSRIAREIHDSLGHSLTTLNVQLDLLKKYSTDAGQEEQEALLSAKELATQALNDVRLAVQSLRHSNFHLEDSIRSLVKDTAQAHTIEIELLSAVPTMPATMAFQIYRILQECLTNVLKHAQASKVTINLQNTGQQIELTVADNGLGLPEGFSDGFGITGIKERVSSLHGSMAINTPKGQGTRVEVTIPL